MPNGPREPKASPAKVAYHLSQVSKLFPRATDGQFLQMMWALDALCSRRPDAAALQLTFPPEAANQDVGSRYAIHHWELESLITLFLLTPPRGASSGRIPTFDCTKFGSVAELVNRLRKLEDTESAVYLSGTEFNIFGEMHRIAQRQFHWQRGYWNLPNFYRYAFIYAQGKCAEYFEKEHGFSISAFSYVGFALIVQSTHTPWISRNLTVPEAGLTKNVMEQALSLLLITVDRARKEIRKVAVQMNEKHGRPLPTAFLPSILRRFPLISLNEEVKTFVAPIAETLLMRVTSGLYYDLIRGGQELLNEANDRFEEYCCAYIDAQMERFEVSRAYRYEQKKGNSIDTPDLVVRDGERVAIIVECKATKLTYLAQFAENPFDADMKQYLQIANGVLQLWRFLSHARRGLLHEPIDPNTSAMVLTLDSFLTASRELRVKIVDHANLLADREGDIAEEDRRHVVFCPIQDLVEILRVSTEDEFLASVKIAGEEKYVDWELREISRAEQESVEKRVVKRFPFKLDGLLPWWGHLEALRP
jgi:hypothetical protein